MSKIVECVGDCRMCLLLVECCLCLFSVSVEFLFTLLAEIALVSEIVECVGNCVVCRRLVNVSEIVECVYCFSNVIYCFV